MFTKITPLEFRSISSFNRLSLVSSYFISYLGVVSVLLFDLWSLVSDLTDRNELKDCFFVCNIDGELGIYFDSL